MQTAKREKPAKWLNHAPFSEIMDKTQKAPCIHKTYSQPGSEPQPERGCFLKTS